MTCKKIKLESGKKAAVYIVLFLLLFLVQEKIVYGAEEGVIDICVIQEDSVVTDRIIRKALANIGYGTNIFGMKMSSAIVAVNDGQYAILAAYVGGMEKEYENLIPVPVSIGSMSFNVYGKKENKIEISGWESLSGYRVGAQYQRPYTSVNLEKLDGTTVLRYKEKTKLMEALEQNLIDLIVIPTLYEEKIYCLPDIELKGRTEEKPVYVYVNKRYERMVPLLEKELEKMKKSGELGKLQKEGLPEEDEKKVILHIMSYSTEIEEEGDLNAGIRETLLQFQDVQLHTMSLNSNLQENHNARFEMFGDMLRNDYGLRPPDVIIVSGNYALDFLKEYYFQLLEGTPIIFISVDGAEFSGFGNKLIYLEKKIPLKETVEEILSLYPDTKEIYTVNDILKDGQAWEHILKKELAAYENRVKITYSGEITFEELLKELRTLPKDTIVLSGTYYGDKSERYYSGKEIQTLFGENYSVPVFSCNVTGLGEGELGGKYINKLEIGRYAGSLAIEIINGKEPEKIQIDESRIQSQWVFDYTQLIKWNIKESQLPQGSIIINKGNTLKEKNPAAYYLGIALIVLGMITIAALGQFTRLTRKKNKELVRMQKNLVEIEEVLKKDQAIRKGKEKLGAIIESAPLAYTVADANGAILETNNYAREKIGFQAGKNIGDYYGYKERYESLAERVKSNENISGEIVEYQMEDGTLHRFHLNMTAFNEHGEFRYIIWAINVEELEQQKDAYKKTQWDLKQIIDSLPWPMCIVNPKDLTFYYRNAAFKGYFNLEENEKDNSVLNIVSEYQPNGELSWNYLKMYVERIMKLKRTMEIEVEHMLQNGERRLMRTIGTEIVYDGKDSISVILQDISAQKELEEHLRNTAAKEKEANQLKNKFIINMSHEIRTPMNAVIGLSDIELLKEHSPEVKQSFAKINASAKLLLTIVNDILDFSKMEADKIEIEEEEFVLEEVISNALNTSSPRLLEKDVEMLVRMDKEVPKKLFGDKTRLWQIIKNVLDNSAKFTDKGKIVLDISIKEMVPKQTTISFIIEDTGRGMSEKELESIFIPFEQFGENKSKIEGTGLGMAIIKELVQRMRGSIQIESQINVGTRTEIIIPFKSETKEQPIGKEWDDGSLKGKWVLIVDDEPTACEIMRELLQAVGAETVILMETDKVMPEILERYENGKAFDIILLDHMLDKSTGIDIARELKKYTIGDPKIIMVSAHAKLRYNDIAKEQIFIDVIDKPFIASEFLSKISNALWGKGEGKEEMVERLHFPNAKVLICEDNVINQDVIKGILNFYSIDPVIADNGKKGIDLLEEHKFDLVIMDMLMPVMDGHTATIKIRTSEKDYKDIPIIALTANAMKEERERCKREGMNGYISKPIDLDMLYEELLKWLPTQREIPEAKAEIQEEPGDLTVLEEMGVDISQGTKRFGGNLELYKKTLKNYAKDTLKKEFPLFNENMEDAEKEEFKRYIHTIKGVTANLSLNTISEKIKNFEQTLKEGAPKEEDYRMIKGELTDLVKKIQVIFDKEETRSLNGGIQEYFSEYGKYERYQQLIRDLSEFLPKGKAKECEEIKEQLREKNWEGATKDTVEEICNAIDSYDYVKAMELVQQCMLQFRHAEI